MNKTQTNAIINIFIGEKLGQGGSREVFALRDNIHQVIKIERSFTVQNTIEFEIWCQFSETKEGKKWLARCFNKSDDGVVLIQERLNIIKSFNDTRLPKKIPNFLTDLKIANWGIDKKGNVKCCDYGVVLMLQNNPWKMKKADWW